MSSTRVGSPQLTAPSLLKPFMELSRAPAVQKFYHCVAQLTQDCQNKVPSRQSRPSGSRHMGRDGNACFSYSETFDQSLYDPASGKPYEGALRQASNPGD